MDRVLHTVLFEESLTMEGRDASEGRGQSLSLSLSLSTKASNWHILYIAFHASIIRSNF